MVTSERLLQLVAQLQSEPRMTHGRRMLLEFVRKICRARLTVLFVLDEQQQHLELLDYAGRRPEQVWGTESNESASIADNHTEKADGKRMSRDGLLGSALLTEGPLYTPDLYHDSRTLPIERNWGWPEGAAILTAIRAGKEAQSEQGVLLISYASTATRQPEQDWHQLLTQESEDDLLVCRALLVVYLSRTSTADHRQETTSTTAQLIEQPWTHWNAHQDLEDEGLRPGQTSNLPELMYSLTCLSDLYELGLAAGATLPRRDLYQHILTHLRKVVRARGACLLLYQETRERFITGAIQGEALPCMALLSVIDGKAVERLAMRGPGETVTSLFFQGQPLVLVTLSYNTTLLGAALLGVSDDSPLAEERVLLLSHMGNVAAVLLCNYNLRGAEREEAITHERIRIARDIHDSVAQQVALVQLKLEYLQRILEQWRYPEIESVLEELHRTHDLVQNSLQELRTGIAQLVPEQLEQLGLGVALERLLTEFKNNTPDVELTSSIIGINKLSRNLGITVYRLLQEALNNITKHAHATRVSISLRALPGQFLVEVSDNGRGFPVEFGSYYGSNNHREGVAIGIMQHMGLRTMRERVQESGGSWDIQSRPGIGTTIRARIPLTDTSTKLTSRELEVLRLIVEGLTNRGIAERLLISVETVKSHIHHIMQKMQVKDRTQAAVVAMREGMLQ